MPSSTTIKKYKIIQKTAVEEYLILHPETDADVVLLAADGIMAANVKDALIELHSKIGAITVSQIGKTGKLADGIDDDSHRLVTDAEKQSWNDKQNKLTFDTTPTKGSENPITSGGVEAALGGLSDIARTGNLADAGQDATHRVVTDAEKNKWNTAADRTIPTKTSNLTNDGEGNGKFATEAYVDEKTSKVYRYKGTVDTFEELPTSNEVGDVYNVVGTHGDNPAGTNYAWDGEAWDALGGSVDLSKYILASNVSEIGKTGNLADAIQDATHRLVTDTEKATWNAKQDKITIDTAMSDTSANPVQNKVINAAVKDAKKAGTDAQATANTAIGTANTAAADIVKITNGTTKVGKSGTADNATNVTTNINGKAISTIFETDGITAKKATAASTLATARNIKLTTDVTGSASFNGGADATIAATLSNTGVKAGTYSAVTVDAKGRATAGAQVVEVGEEGQDAPSANLAVGGLFFKLI